MFTKKHGGGRSMVWGCISCNGVSNLVFIDGNLNSVKYVNLLANHLDASACKMGLIDYTFQPDGAPCHTSRRLHEYFDRAMNFCGSIIVLVLSLIFIFCHS